MMMNGNRLHIERRINMSNKKINNNNVEIFGNVASNPVFNHEIFGEGFYNMSVAAKRLSGEADFIPVTISERLIDVSENVVGAAVYVEGEFRSYNKHEEGKNRLLLSVFAQEFEVIGDNVDVSVENNIYLEGHICKQPVYRKTPKGREIADLLLAVNRPYGKSDYIPCICWGRNARFVGGLNVGDLICVKGRVQSREYEKRVSETEKEIRTAYEVSVSKIEVIDNER